MKRRQAVIRREFVPRPRVDVAADPFDVEDPLEGDQHVGIDTEIRNVVVPAGMLAERGKVQGRVLLLALAAQFLEHVLDDGYWSSLRGHWPSGSTSL